MSKVVNMVGGGGGGGGLKDTDAVLVVTAPTSSTVTATKGGVTLTPTMWVTAADNTLDCAIFSIKSSLFDAVNPWTVTATLGTDTASDTVIIDDNKEYDLELSFTFWLYKDGNEFVNRTGGWEVKKEGSTYRASKEPTYLHLDSAASNGQSISTVDKVDLSNFSAFCFTLKDAVTGGGGNYRAGVVWQNESGPTNSYTRIATTTINETAAGVELSVDISGLSAAYKVGFISWNGQVFNVDKAWLR